LLRGGSTTTTRLMRTGLAAAALGSAFIAAPAAQAIETGPGISPNHFVTVFHNIDFVAVSGQAEDNVTSVEIFRGEHRIGVARGPAVEGAEGTGLEVNHGPEGGVRDGDCFIGFTPDMQPGDRVVVTELRPNAPVQRPGTGTTIDDPANPGTQIPDPANPPIFDPVAPTPVVDEVTIDDIVIEEGPVLLPNGHVRLRGHARDATGAPIAIETLRASTEVVNTSDFVGRPNTLVSTDANGGWEMTFDPSRPLVEGRERNEFAGMSTAQRRDALMSASYGVGYGHTEDVPPEVQLWDGTAEETPGPADGCNAPSQSNRVTGADDEIINSTSGDLNVTGTAMAGTIDALGAPLVDITGVTVTATDGTTTVTSATANDLTGNALAWNAAFTRDQLITLNDGPITVSALYDLAGGGTLTGTSKVITKDTGAPAAAVASKAAGTYTGATSVELSAAPGSTITYAINGGGFQAYTGAIPLRVGTTTLTVRVTDAAGNVTTSTLRYVVNPVPAPAPAPRAAAPAPVVQIAPPLVVQPSAVFRPAAPSLKAAGKRVKLSVARRKGLTASFATPRGAKLVVARLYRTRGTKRTLIATKRMSVRANRRHAIKFAGGKLKTGLYLFEVRAGASRTALGAPGVVRVRVVR
jgi:Chitobiase/beta-hexosaminidase C-terminal domain